MSKVTFFNAVQSGTTPAIALDPQTGAAGATNNRVVKKILVGKPVANATITVFKIDNALANDTTDIAFQYTYPSSFSNINPTDQFLFSTGEQAASAAQVDGMVLPEGGSIALSSAMQVSVLWDLPEA